MEKEVLFSLGTNLGERKSNIDRALEMLTEALGRNYDRISPVIETEAYGFDGPAFLNCVVSYRTDLNPEALLAVCKRIERDMGRMDSPEFDNEGKRIYHDRIIDIDILTCGDVEIHTQELTIPHPQVYTRPFIQKLLLLLQDIT